MTINKMHSSRCIHQIKVVLCLLISAQVLQSGKGSIVPKKFNKKAAKMKKTFAVVFARKSLLCARLPRS